MPRRRQIRQLEDGEILNFPSPIRFLGSCCDCGLVHEIAIRSEADRLLICFTRRDRLTATRRRARRIKVISA